MKLETSKISLENKEKGEQNLNNTEMTNIDEVFPHIAGYEEVKNSLYQLVDMVKNPEIYQKRSAHLPSGWLLYGEPGNGKTRIVKDLIDYLKLPSYEISASAAIGQNISVQKLMVDCFEEAEKNDLSILFIDEIEKIAGYDKNTFDIPENIENRKILLRELDRAHESGKMIVLATCNNMKLLGKAFIRSGRFDRKLNIKFARAKDREKIIRHYLKDVDVDPKMRISDVLKITTGFSCAGLESVINDAIILSVSQREKFLTFRDINQAVLEKKNDDIHNGCWTKNMLKIIAYHIAGHAYIAYRVDPGCLISASLLEYESNNGYCTSHLEDNVIPDMKDLEDEILIQLGGIASVNCFLKKHPAINVNDFSVVSSILKDMLDEGFFGEMYINFEPDMNSVEQNNQRVYQARGKIVYYMEKAEKLVKEGEEEIKALARSLMKKKFLTAEEIISVIYEAEKKNDK